MKALKIFSDAALSDSAAKLLREGVAPHEVISAAKPAGSILAKSEPDPAFADADIAFGQPDLVNIHHSNRLRWVQLTSAGFTRYDTPEFRAAATARGLLVTNSSTVFSEPCAEHVLAFMLAQSRLLPQSIQTNHGYGSAPWQKFRADATLLRHQNVLLLGFGAIALRLVELLRPFEMKLAALRRKPKGNEPIAIVTREQLPQALAQADHVVNILPESRETARFINAERLASMKRGAFFYNIGRGATVDQDALVEALRSGRLGAAWLDVTSPEPLPAGHPLLSAPNCFITPHTGGGQPKEAEALVRHFLHNFRLYLEGAPLTDRVI